MPASGGWRRWNGASTSTTACSGPTGPRSTGADSARRPPEETVAAADLEKALGGSQKVPQKTDAAGVRTLRLHSVFAEYFPSGHLPFLADVLTHPEMLALQRLCLGAGTVYFRPQPAALAAGRVPGRPLAQSPDRRRLRPRHGPAGGVRPPAELPAHPLLSQRLRGGQRRRPQDHPRQPPVPRPGRMQRRDG